MKNTGTLSILILSFLIILYGCPSTENGEDTTPPAPGNSGTITTADIAVTSITLNWTAATDNETDEAQLEYLAYYSTSDTIDTVADMEANGTAVGSYTANMTTQPVISLSGSTTYYFNVIVRDEAGNKAAYTTVSETTATPGGPDTTDPVPGNSGTITTSGITSGSITLNWTAATDNVTAQANLEYLVYYSASNNIATVTNIETNGTAVGSYTSNMTTRPVSSLSGNTTYYFNVIVRDEAGNKAAYTTVSETTASVSDTTDPTPGNSGTLTTSGITSGSITVNWTAATDNVTAQANLEYLVYYSTSNNIATVTNMEANGTPVGSYTANITTRPVSSLSASTSYYFNVIVRDEADNKAAYTTVTASTTAMANLYYNLNTNPGWTTTGDWAYGTPGVGPGGTNGGCYGTVINNYYSNDMTFASNYVQIGPIDLTQYTGTIRLDFLMYLDIDDDYDSAGVFISTNGSSFSNFGITDVTPNYDGDGYWEFDRSTWTQVQVDLSSYASETTVYFRWVMQTDDYGYPDAGEEGGYAYGFYIDNIEIGSF